MNNERLAVSINVVGIWAFEIFIHIYSHSVLSSGDIHNLIFAVFMCCIVVAYIHYTHELSNFS